MLVRLHHIALVAVLVTTGAAAQSGNYITGNKLHEWAEDAAKRPDISSYLARAHLHGYVMGVHDASRENSLFCIPDRVQAGQLTDVVIRYLAAHPEVRHEDADRLVFTALALAWPCPKPAPKPPASTPDKPGTGKQGS
jgi:hypothetical protein